MNEDRYRWGTGVLDRLARELGLRVGDTLRTGNAVDSLRTAVVVDAICWGGLTALAQLVASLVGGGQRAPRWV